MVSSTKRFPPNEWLQRKATIRGLYLTEKRSLDDIVQVLACDDFHPNKHQLEHRIKLWGFNKNIPKSLADATWRYIGYEIANRRARGEETEVVLFDQVQDKRKVEVETRRYYRFRYGGEPVPRPPEDVRILLRTPSYQKSIPWPLCLPWLRFQSTYMAGLPLRISSIHSKQSNGDWVGNYMLAVTSATSHYCDELSASLSESSFASLLKTTMPELYPGEATDRAKIILQGWSKQALEEQIVIFLFHLSNKALSKWLSWELIVDIIERSGMMSASIMINDTSSTTLLAIREMLFQLSFKVIFQSRAYGIVDIDIAMPRILGLIKWLLRSGQPSDTAIYHYFEDGPRHITPLQVAAWAHSIDLLAVLLENGADPNLALQRPNIERPVELHHDRREWAMPPLFLAAHSARQPDDLNCLDLMLSFGATIHYCRSPKHGFLSSATFFTLLAGKKEEGIALDIIKMFTTRPMGIAYLEVAKSLGAADIAISAASRGNIEILKFLRDNDFDVTRANEFGLTALHAAAYEGHVKCCTFLLRCGFDADHHDLARPSPVHLACYRNHIEVVKLLHGQGACIDRELSIPPRLRKLVLKRYFCGEEPCHLKRATTLLAQLQSPIGAALCKKPKERSVMDYYGLHPYEALSRRRMSNDVQPPFSPYAGDSLAPLVSYLLHHNVTIPSFALYCAADLCDTELLLMALAAGADPNFSGLDGKTPLHPALDFESLVTCPENESEHKDSIQIGKLLLNAGADATRRDAVRAIRSGDRELVNEILGHTLLDPPKPPWLHFRMDDNMTLLEAALLSGDLCIIQQVLKRDPISYSPGALCAATLQAVKAVIDSDIVYQLLQYRDSNFKSEECLTLETTAVGIAACYDSPNILERLLTYIPVFNAARTPSKSTKTPMKEALETESSRYGTPFWHYGFKGCSVLIYAPESNTNVMSKLLNHGYRFDWMVVADMAPSKNEEQYMNIISGQPKLFQDEADPTLALSEAIRSGNTNRVQSLLQVYMASEGGKLRLSYMNWPLRVAIEIGNTEMFDTLLKAGISPGAPAKDFGMTALQATAIYNRAGLAKRLIDLKVDVNAPGATRFGRTALEGAAEHGHIDLIKLLLHSGVETDGSAQLHYLRAIGLATLNCHYVAADMLKSHRKLTEEDLSILERNQLFETKLPRDHVYYDCDYFSDGVSSPAKESEDEGEGEGEDEDENSQRDGDEDENSSADRRGGTADDHLTVVHTKDTVFDQKGNHQTFQISRDETLLFYDDETDEHSLNFSNDDIMLRQEPSSVLDTTAPSEGIYDFDYPLFGVYDMEDLI